MLNVYTFLVDVTEAHIASLGGKIKLSTDAAMLLTWFSHLVSPMKGKFVYLVNANVGKILYLGMSPT